MKKLNNKTDRTNLIYHLHIKKIGKVSSVGNFSSAYACPVCGKSLEYSPACSHIMGRYSNVVKTVEITCSHCGSELETDIGVLDFITMRDKACMPNSAFTRGLFDRAKWYTKSEFHEVKKDVKRVGYSDAVYEKYKLGGSFGIVSEQTLGEFIFNIVISILAFVIFLILGLPHTPSLIDKIMLVMVSFLAACIVFGVVVICIAIFNVIYDKIISSFAKRMIIKK